MHEDGFTHTHGAGAPKEWVVTYTADSEFVPEYLEIVTGDTVTWTNESSCGVWPSSNIHPSHEIYSDFDPLGDIEPGETWSFTFTRNGTWRYHNHSYASETGTIVSSGGPEEALDPLDLDVDAPALPDPPQDYDPVPLLSDVDSLELFGVAAFLITPHECDSGATNGVLEALFAERGTARLEEDMRVVCTGMSNRHRMNKCVPDVGHGIMAWSGYELHESLGMCDVLEAADRRSCYSGVFMENGVAGRTGLSDHESEYISIVDAHYPCNEVAQRHVTDCYGWQPSNLMLHMELTTEGLFGFCDGLLGHVRRMCMRSWPTFESNRWWPDAEGMIAVCEDDRLSHSDRLACLGGISMARFAETDDAVLTARFCAAADHSEILHGELADSCWSGLLGLAPQVLAGRAGRDGFCGSIADLARRDQCTATLLG